MGVEVGRCALDRGHAAAEPLWCRCSAGQRRSKVADARTVVDGDELDAVRGQWSNEYPAAWFGMLDEVDCQLGGHKFRPAASVRGGVQSIGVAGHRAA
jgi:hypothetical protein